MMGHMWAAVTALSSSPLFWVLPLCVIGYGITWVVARRG